jgi:hypothetical protein
MTYKNMLRLCSYVNLSYIYCEKNVHPTPTPFIHGLNAKTSKNIYGHKTFRILLITYSYIEI